MKIAVNKYDIFIEVICLVCLISITTLLVVLWSGLPAQLPAHFNAAGEIYRMGDKGGLIFLVVINWVLYAFITVLERFPQIWNTGVAVTEENKGRVYRVLKSMIGTVKLICVLDFTYMAWKMIQGQSLPAAFTLVVLAAVFGSIIFFLIRLFRVR